MKKLNWLLILVMGLILVITPIVAQDTPDEAANKAMVEEFFVMEANRQWSRIGSHLANHFTRHSMATQAIMPEVQVTNPSEYIDFLKANATMFPDYYNDPQMIVADGDYVSFYSIFNGSFVENGNRISVPIAGVFRFEGNKIAEMWVEWDNLTWNNQMMAEPMAVTEEPISSMEDVAGLSRIYMDEDWAAWYEIKADGTYTVGELGCLVPGGCLDWGEYAVEDGQIHFLTASTQTCAEAKYDVFRVTRGDQVGLRFAAADDDCYEGRKTSLDGKTIFFVGD